MMYTINEVELQCDAEGRAEFSMRLPSEQAPGGGQALVVIERLPTSDRVLSEDAPEIDAKAADIASENLSRTNNVAVFAGAVREGAESLNISFTGRVGERFRVFVGWTRRRAAEARADLSCEICRRALKAAIRAALAAIGIPTPGEIISEGIERLAAELATGGIAAFLDELFHNELLGKRFSKWLSGRLDTLLGVIRAIDDLCRTLCRELGYCR